MQNSNLDQLKCQAVDLAEGQADLASQAALPLSYLFYAALTVGLGVADGGVFCEDAVPLQTLFPRAWRVRQSSTDACCCRIVAQVHTGAIVRPQILVRVGEG